MAVEIGNPLGWYAFLSAALLFLLYLIRPKPFKTVIPSILFLEKDRVSKMKNSFFRRLLLEMLFFLQLLILLFLSASTLMPYTMVSRDVVEKDVIMVIDASASMKTFEHGGTRFEKAIDYAIKKLGSSNTIILAKSIPSIVLDHEDAGTAKKMLKSLQAGDSSTALGDAILTAGDIAKGNERVIVVSDFINTHGSDPISAKNLLESKGLSVELKNVGTTRDNVGIVDLSIEKSNAVVFIKNFNDEPRRVKLKNTEDEIEIAPNSIESVTFPLGSGVTKIELDYKDDFEVDNTAFVSMPSNKTIRVLWISNKQTSFVRKVFESMPNVKLDRAEPPIIPEISHDIIIIDNIKKESLLPGTFDEISRAVEGGSSLVIVAQDLIGTIDFKGLLPVVINGENKTKAKILNTGVFDSIKEIDFGVSSKYLVAEPVLGSTVVIAKTNPEIQNSSIITLTDRGAGKILYYGIFDEENNFKLSPDYPLFWHEMVNVLANREKASYLNRRIDEFLIPKEGEVIETPSGKTVEGTILIDEVGVYKVGSARIAANLLNEKESNINLESTDIDISEIEAPMLRSKAKVKFEYASYLIGIAIILIFAELFYVKRRGDF
ncbi:VWA domain-containing protein [Candidatus Woesearchaeota archaeon]|nr:MAG: VWA domain-containing protein [Candidatus Woesearchaeota archaeon]